MQEYIESGIIESYVLGLASPEERAGFEKLCDQYPELQRARIAFEISLEKQAMENAIAPPLELKNKLFDQLTPAIEPVRHLQSGIGWWKYAVAACLVLLAGSLYYNLSLYNRNKQLKADMDQATVKLSEWEKEGQLLQQNPRIKMASMKGTANAPQAFATVYWDTTSKDVYLMVNNLPQPASDQQYQLWSILDGKPIDGGLIDNAYFIRQSRLLIRMKNAQRAQTFAITLEKKGGNPTPQGKMVVLGGI